MNYLFVVNPIAGGVDRTEEIRALAEKTFAGRPDDRYEIYVTKSKGDATKEIKRRAEEFEKSGAGNDGVALRVLSCGGDGTFNECCNGAAHHGCLAVCPFPVGTGNDFCRMFGEQKELYRNLPAILDGSIHPIDLANANGHYCACIASVGFDARVGMKVHNYTHLPLCKGPGAYVASLLVELCKGMTRRVKFTCGDYHYEGEYTLCAVCNGRHYGGGFNPSANAMPDDGILDIYFIKKIGFLKFLTNVGKYKNGRSDEIEIVTHLRGVSVSFEFDEDTEINCDGEEIRGTRAEIKLEPRCLNLIVPKGVSFFNK